MKRKSLDRGFLDGLALTELLPRWAFLERGIERVMTDLDSGIDMVTVCWCTVLFGELTEG